MKKKFLKKKERKKKNKNRWYKSDCICMGGISPVVFVRGCSQPSRAGLVQMCPRAAPCTAQALPCLSEHRWCTTLIPAGWGWQGFPHHSRGCMTDVPHHGQGKHQVMSSSFLPEGETRPACESRVILETSGAQAPQAITCDYNSCFAWRADKATDLSRDRNVEMLLLP